MCPFRKSHKSGLSRHPTLQQWAIICPLSSNSDNIFNVTDFRKRTLTIHVGPCKTIRSSLFINIYNVNFANKTMLMGQYHKICTSVFSGIKPIWTPYRFVKLFWIWALILILRKCMCKNVCVVMENATKTS